jgi:hypothetical protein
LFAGLLLAGTALAGVTLAGASDRQNAAITQYAGVAPFEDDRGGGVGPDRRRGGNGNGNGGYGHGSDSGSFKPAHGGGAGSGSGAGAGSGSSDAEGTLAFTGFNLVILLVIGLLLVLLGSVLLMRDRAAGRAAPAG